MLLWQDGTKGGQLQLTEEPCEEGENPYSDLSFDSHVVVVVHTRTCMCMYIPSLLTFTSHIHQRDNKTVNRKEDFILFPFLHYCNFL